MWTEGLIIPVHKKGDINEVGNYRGITLLSTMGKLFTRTLNNRLQSWSDRYGIITEAHDGFRKKHSTVDQIFVLHSLISHVLHNKHKLYCSFIDFRRAFDSINHKCLWLSYIRNNSMLSRCSPG